MSTIDAYNTRMAATDGNYKSNPMNTEGLMSSTFSVIKNNIYNALQHAVGLGDNVSIAFLKQMNDPNSGIQAGDKVLYPHPGVGMIQAYNEIGNPSGGVYSLHTIG